MLVLKWWWQGKTGGVWEEGAAALPWVLPATNRSLGSSEWLVWCLLHPPAGGHESFLVSKAEDSQLQGPGRDIWAAASFSFSSHFCSPSNCQSLWCVVKDSAWPESPRPSSQDIPQALLHHAPPPCHDEGKAASSNPTPVTS